MFLACMIDDKALSHYASCIQKRQKSAVSRGRHTLDLFNTQKEVSVFNIKHTFMSEYPNIL